MNLRNFINSRKKVLICFVVSYLLFAICRTSLIFMLFFYFWLLSLKYIKIILFHFILMIYYLSFLNFVLKYIILYWNCLFKVLLLYKNFSFKNSKFYSKKLFINSILTSFNINSFTPDFFLKWIWGHILLVFYVKNNFKKFSHQ